MSDEDWKVFPEEYFTPIEKVVEVVMMIIDSTKKETDGEEPWVGKTIEISGKNHYFRTQYDFCDEPMAAVMGSTELAETSFS